MAPPNPATGIPVEADGEPVPEALFDRAYYREHTPELDGTGLSPRQHFAEFGRRAGRLPSAGAAGIVDAIRHRAAVSDSPMRDIVALVPEDRPGLVRSGRLWERLRMCTHPRFYAAQFPHDHPIGARGADLGIEEAVCHFLVHGAHEGKRISALFHPDWYQQELAARDLAVPDGVHPFFHWLTTGWHLQVVPTPLFDPVVYAERHGNMLEQVPWSFVHYLRKGCYRPGLVPSAVGRHHPGGEVAGAEERHEPLLLQELLRDAESYDLSRTSSLEEDCIVALRVYDGLHTPRMQELVAKVARLEPLIHEPPALRPVAGVPPYRARRAHLNRRAEDMRRDLEITHVDAVVLVPDREPATVAAIAGWVEALRSEGSVLVVATEATGADPAPPGHLDLEHYGHGMAPDQRVDLLLDLVRGLNARRVAVLGSELGWDLVMRFGAQLAALASLGGRFDARDDTAAGIQRSMHHAFGHLDWLVVDQALRDDLVARYAFASQVADRLVVDGADAPRRALAQPRRKRG